MKKSFKRDIRSLDEVFDYLESFISSNRLNESTAFVLKFAVEELFTNMVKHNASGPSEISIGLTVEAEKLLVRLIDRENFPFDVTKLDTADVDLGEEQRHPGGLGLYLTKKMVDKIDFEHVGDQSIITLTLATGK
jgi:serine/threonine-protein kinase RsbW